MYIGRGSPLGNIFRIGVDGTRDDVVEKNKNWLIAKVKERDPAVCTALLRIKEDDSLGCFCYPEKCHGENIIELLGLGIKEDIKARPVKTFRYTGIGSRKTPINVLSLMTRVAKRLNNLGFTLLSGGAEKADTAFEIGAHCKMEIYLPWKNFRQKSGAGYIDYPLREAFDVAKIVHPCWARLKDSAKSLMARNSHQILGENLKAPSDFVITWTPDGCEKSSDRTAATGGTGQAIDLADLWGIPVFNFKNGVGVTLDRIKNFLDENY
jgi:hypothetical protein